MLLQAGKLPPLSLSSRLTYHDPCYLGRHNGIYDAPRAVLTSGDTPFQELPRYGRNSFCCGAGGAQFWKEEEPGDMRVSENRFREIKASGAEVVAAGCPFCRVMLKSSESAEAAGAPEVLDIAQLVLQNLEAIEAKL
jgi:Fe-S oxidoreductase